MPSAEILTIGTEILLGQIVDTNSSWIGEQLALAGSDSHFQVKVGENPLTDISRIRKIAACMEPGEVLNADANTGWKQHQALIVADAIKDLPREHGLLLYFEQPCLTYEECLTVRRHTDLPFVLDECIDSLAALLRAHHDNAMDLINLKINRMGGLTRARQIRDLCVSLGLPMNVEDSWGGEIVTAAIAHLAHSTPAEFQFQSSAFHDYSTVSIADGAPSVKDGYMCANDGPGLGVTADMTQLGEPVFTT